MILITRTGCLLPLLIIFNLFFGLFFLEFRHWLLIEGALVVLFALNAYIFSRRIFLAGQGRQQRRGVIDVKAEVVEEEKKK